jgi:hypothetical protein
LAPEKEPSSSGPQSLLNILVSAFAFLCGWSLAKLRAPSQDASGTQHPQDRPHNATQIGQNIPSPVHVIVDASPPIPTPNKEREAGEERQEGRDKKRLGVEIILAFVTSLLLIANLLLVFTARRANKIASDALYINHRPWVGLDGGIQFPEKPRFEIYPTNRMVHLSVRYFVKNYGTAPALNAVSYAMIFAEKGIPKRPEIPMNTSCSFADDDRKNKRGAVIFPNEPVRAGSDPGTTFDPTMHTMGQIWITICTSYGDDAGKVHHTKTWALTQPPKDEQPVIAVPGYSLLYYPVFEAQIFGEETD